MRERERKRKRERGRERERERERGRERERERERESYDVISVKFQDRIIVALGSKPIKKFAFFFSFFSVVFIVA